MLILENPLCKKGVPRKEVPMKRALIPIAPGFEEIEALTVVDILRRAGVEVTMAGTVEGPIEGRTNIKILPDTSLDRVMDKEFDLIVLPGGKKGTENLKGDDRVREIVVGHFKKERLTAAICAAPTVLSFAGITKGRTVTSHPSVREELKHENISDERVVVDGNIVTSQGPGTAMEFAFKLVELLLGKDRAKEVNQGVLARA